MSRGAWRRRQRKPPPPSQGRSKAPGRSSQSRIASAMAAASSRRMRACPLCGRVFRLGLAWPRVWGGRARRRLRPCRSVALRPSRAVPLSARFPCFLFAPNFFLCPTLVATCGLRPSKPREPLPGRASSLAPDTRPGWARASPLARSRDPDPAATPSTTTHPAEILFVDHAHTSGSY